MTTSSDNSEMQEGTTKTSSDGRRQFKLTRRVGLGGFGEVYLAEMSTSSGFTKTVALKLLRTDKEGEGDNARRMRDEARLLGLLRHRAIVQADDLITIDGRTAVIMEYIPGANLSDILDRSRFPHPLPACLGLEVAVEIADAMDAAWTRPSEVTGKPLEVLHRDIKPGNVRLTPDGQVKILDFGIARAEKMDRETATRDYAVGSLPYMAPELLVGHGASPASDIYALGVTLLETLSRARFGIAQDTAEGHDARLAERVSDIEFPELEPRRDDLVGLLRGMMAFDPAERPGARDVERRLRELIHSLHMSSLHDWAREWVPQVRESGGDEPLDSLSREDLSGQIFFEDIASKADTWDGDTMGLTKEQLHGSQPGSLDNSWIWKTALILLVGLVLVLGYQLIQSDDEAPGSEAETTSGAEDGNPVASTAPSSSTEAPMPALIETTDPPSDPALVASPDGSDEGSPESEQTPPPANNSSGDEPSANSTGEVIPVVSIESPSSEDEESTVPEEAPTETAAVVMATAKFQSVPNRGVLFRIDGRESEGGRELRTPRKLELSAGPHEVICNPQGQSFSATIVVPAEGGTWICNTTLGEVKGP